MLVRFFSRSLRIAGADSPRQVGRVLQALPGL
jgi:hypothetical protein